MNQIDLCADFSIFPDNHKPPDNFFLAGFQFTNRNPGRWIVNESGGERGLQFSPPGMEFTLPGSAHRASLRIGQFNAPIDVDALSPDGTVVQTQQVNSPNQYVDVIVQGSPIHKIVLSGGGNEGILQRVCICLLVQPCEDGE